MASVKYFLKALPPKGTYKWYAYNLEGGGGVAFGNIGKFRINRTSCSQITNEDKHMKTPTI